MDVNSGRSRPAGSSGLHRAPRWRRSGDWEGLTVQEDGPPRAARPQSCLEGLLMEDWLKTLERLQTDPATGPPHYLQNRPWTSSVGPSLDTSSLDSLDSLEDRSGLETKEKARIKTRPSAQKAKLCRLAPVRIGWLPLQRHVIINDGAKSNMNQVRLKPPITPVLNTSLHSTTSPVSPLSPVSPPAAAERGGVGGLSAVLRPWRTSTHSFTQAAPVERNQEVAHDPTSRGQMPRSQPSSLMWMNPAQTRGSFPGSPPVTAPPIDGSPGPKYSSSISSITITSRRVVRSSSLPNTSLPPQPGGDADGQDAVDYQADPSKCSKTQSSKFMPQRRAVVVKVTEQSSKTSTFLLPGDKTSPVSAFPANLTTGKSNSSFLTTRRSPSPTSNPTRTENHSPSARDGFTPGVSCHSRVPSNLGTAGTHQPVVLRRKATIVKVEHRESFRRESKGRVENRHSYSEGFRATSSVTYTSNPSYAKSANEARLAGSVQPEKSNEKVKELHRSTLSFQLSCPPCNESSSSGPPFTRPPSNGPPSNGSPSTRPPSTGPPFTRPPYNGSPSNGPPSTRPPSNGTPSTRQPSSVPPSTGPPSNGPPSKGPPSKGPPSNGSPSYGLPSNGPPSSVPPSSVPPSSGPPSNGSPSTRPPSHRPHIHKGSRPRRPASCYGSIFSPSDPSADVSKDSGFLSTTSTLPRNTNIDPESFAGSSSNRRWSSAGESRSRDQIYPARESSAGHVGPNEKPAERNQLPFTLIKIPESSAHTSHEAILALNAAAVIANIKRQSLQRKNMETSSSSSSQSKTAESSTADKVCNGQRREDVSQPAERETAVCVKHHHTEFIPLLSTHTPSTHTHTLSKALENSRPDFIRRSQARVKAVKQRARARQQLNTHTHTPAQRQSDNILKSRDKNISAKQQIRRSHSNQQEVKKRKEEEKKKSTSQTNRSRLDLFKKKILDQVLHRGKD